MNIQDILENEKKVLQKVINIAERGVSRLSISQLQRETNIQKSEVVSILKKLIKETKIRGKIDVIQEKHIFFMIDPEWIRKLRAKILKKKNRVVLKNLAYPSCIFLFICYIVSFFIGGRICAQNLSPNSMGGSVCVWLNPILR